MKAAAILILSLACLLAFEGQTGSRAAPLPPAFDQVRPLHNVDPDGRLRSIRVMTWNIDHGAHLDRIAAEMARNPADICLLQEVDLHTRRGGERDVAAELAQRLRLNGVFGIEFEELGQEDGRPAYIGQATLTRLPFTGQPPVMSTVANARVLRFEHQSGFWKPRAWIPSSAPLLQRRVGNRIALVTELQFAGKMLVVYNAHLESRSAGAIQDRQLEEILRDSQRYPASTSIIIGGDLNTKYFPSIFLHKLEAAGFRSALGEHIERTHTIVMALDWIFVKGPLRVTGGAVRRDIKGSDHYPVYATVVSASEPGSQAALGRHSKVTPQTLPKASAVRCRAVT